MPLIYEKPIRLVVYINVTAVSYNDNYLNSYYSLRVYVQRTRIAVLSVHSQVLLINGDSYFDFHQISVSKGEKNNNTKTDGVSVCPIDACTMPSDAQLPSNDLLLILFLLFFFLLFYFVVSKNKLKL